MPKIIARKYENPSWINITVLLDTHFYDQVRSDCSKYTTCTCLYCSFKYGSCFILLYVFLFFIELVNTSEFSNVSWHAQFSSHDVFIDSRRAVVPTLC